MSEHDEDCMCGAETESGKTGTKNKQVSVLSQSIYDKSVLSPAELAKIAKVSQKSDPKGIVSRCSGTQPFKLEDMEVEKVLVEYRLKSTKKEKEKIKEEPKKKILETPQRLTICESLKLAGFQSDWTKEKIASLLKTPDGSELLQKVDMEYRKLSGKSSLSESDILSCFPNYLKKEKRNVELIVELDSNEHILSVSEKKDKVDKADKDSKKKKSKFSL
jgi:hypothetical protein